MKTMYLNEGNPLVKYQRELARENVGKRVNNWKIVSERTGLHLQTIMSLARVDYNGVLRMSLKNYLRIKETIGVDMLSFSEEDKQS